MQSRRMSLIESFVNVLIGIGIAYLTQVLVFPLFGIHVGASTHLSITLIFTVVSLVHSYFLRRLFNRIRA
ncbi:MAG TPA: hypothetical protein VFP33_06950 [Gallionella sp.]|nr:hypothetical protein [Gallionella sp.]